MMAPNRRFAAFLTFASCSLATAATALYANPAEACGGTFCDSGPTAMPVDQSGENVIFVMEPGLVEAHIQIQYDPDTAAEKFAWVIPVQVIPEFTVGSELFFDAVLNATVPTYGYSSTFDSCGDQAGGSSFTGGVSTGGFDGGAESGTGGDEGGGGPSVVFRDTVGAFEIAVLEGGSIEEVMMWLADNGYEQDPAAMPILGQYLDEGFLFAAMKLTHDAGTDTIHPITLRMTTDEACVPLRLTAIAATEDMDVRTFFFGNERVVPTNYRHVEVNPLKIDWMNLAANYKDVVTLAVDAESAEGNAFVTEYAGDDAFVDTNSFYFAGWAPAPGQVAALVDTPVGLYEILEASNLFYCDTEWDLTCYSNHPLMDGILNQYVPVPDGIERLDFYSCLSCYEGLIDLTAWDAVAFSEALQERIIDPGLRARAIVETYPYITRMYTTISDVEMNEDPIFRPNPDLEPVAQRRIAQRQVHCNDAAHMTLPDGRVVYMPDSNVWPDIFPDEMPWEETVQAGTLTGALMPLAQRTEEINALLAEWNDRSPYERAKDSQGACACSTDGNTGAGFAFAGLGLLGLIGLRRRGRKD